MLVNIQSFITHTMFFSSYSSLHSINWMKANDTRTHNNNKILIVLLSGLWFVYTRGNFAHWITRIFVRTILGFFGCYWKFPGISSDGQTFFISHGAFTPTKKKRNAYPILESQWKTNHFHIACNWIFRCFFSCFSIGVVSCWLFVLLFLRCCCLFVSVCCVWQKCQSLFDWSNLHTVQRIYTHGWIRAISFIKMLWISFLSSWIFDSLILTFPLFPFT